MCPEFKKNNQALKSEFFYDIKIIKDLEILGNIDNDFGGGDGYRRNR